ncbi:MAG: tRNA pseudouridine(38-40) synthase TruA [Candidatus Shikimatogenerans sp. JK-2022]|nr:tRNA pseudouridine(38-40) synthase TruA [Candidatus Shikimatogenerans bostrichidophilus]
MRFFIKLSYNGINYHGWQKQKNNNTIEEEIEKKFSIILKENINIIGASRTDSGVHANIMFAHFDYNFNIIKIKKKIIYKINLIISKDIKIKDIFAVKPKIHARYNVLYREYKYIISYEKNPFNLNFYWYWWRKKKININLMNKAIEIIIKRKNFFLFCKKKKEIKKNYNCNIYYAFWKKINNKIFFFIKANRFLRKMVRFIISKCIEIGIKKINIYDLRKKIQNNKLSYNINVPPYGLYLNKIKYKKNIFL